MVSFCRAYIRHPSSSFMLCGAKQNHICSGKLEVDSHITHRLVRQCAPMRPTWPPVLRASSFRERPSSSFSLHVCTELLDDAFSDTRDQAQDQACFSPQGLINPLRTSAHMMKHTSTEPWICGFTSDQSGMPDTEAAPSQTCAGGQSCKPTARLAVRSLGL